MMTNEELENLQVRRVIELDNPAPRNTAAYAYPGVMIDKLLATIKILQNDNDTLKVRAALAENEVERLKGP